MATYRCLSCGAMFIDPQPSGVRTFHACPEDRVGPDGKRVPVLERRDENIVQDERTGRVSIRARGKGRVLVSPGDLLTGATPELVTALHNRAAVKTDALPEEEHEIPKVWVGWGSNR